MKPARSEPYDRVPRPDVRAVDDLIPVQYPHGEPREIELAFAVKPRHLGRLSPEERAARLLAPLHYALYDLRPFPGIELRGGDIIEEEEGVRAARDYIVHVHGHEVYPDGVEPPGHESDLEFRT